MRIMQDGAVQEASAAVPGWKRPSITVPTEGESSHSRRLSSSAAGSSMPWPAISPKEAVTAEQEAWCAPACSGATLCGMNHMQRHLNVVVCCHRWI